MNSKLARTYYNPDQPGSFGGVAALTRNVKNIKTKDAKKWLSSSDTYTLHKPVRRRFVRRKTIVSGLDDQWQADLIDVRGLKNANNGYAYLLTCIDILSKFAWVVPLKKKTGDSLIEAFRKILKGGRRPEALQTDKGTEFKNKSFQQFLRDKNIHFFTTQNEETKAAVVERFNRTLKEKMWRYFTRMKSVRYINVLTKLVKSYNHSYHRSIKLAPVDVNKDNQEEIWQRLYSGDEKMRKKKIKFKIGDVVRMSKSRRIFKKGYLTGWTNETFIVSKVLKKTTPVTYRVRDENGEQIEGTFYAEELQKVHPNS